MKKLLSCLLAFCLLCGLGIYNINSSILVKANDTNIEIIHEPFKGEEFNHVFTQEELKGKIVDVIETGYQLHDRVIRFAKVVTGN